MLVLGPLRLLPELLLLALGCYTTSASTATVHTRPATSAAIARSSSPYSFLSLRNCLLFKIEIYSNLARFGFQSRLVGA